MVTKAGTTPKRGSTRITWLLIVALIFVFLYAVRAILLPFVVGMLLAYFLNPAADRMAKEGLPRALGALLLIASVFLAVIAAGLFVVPMLVHQCAALVAAIPDTVADLQTRYIPELKDWVTQHIDPAQAEALKTAAGNIAGSVAHFGGEVIWHALASGVAVLTVLSLLLITPLVAFYLLLDWHAIIRRISRLLPVLHAATINEQMRKIDATLAGFLRGQLTVCLLLMVYYGLLLTFSGLNFGLLIGLASGLLVIFPYVGILFMATCALIVGLIQFGPTEPLAVVACIYLAGQVLEGYFLTPRLVGNRVGLHPLWIIFGMLSGGAMFGLLGVLIAVPVTAVVGVLIRFAAERYMHSALYYGR